MSSSVPPTGSARSYTIDLRSDLRQLTDEELAKRLEEAWDAYNAAEKRPQWSWLLWSERGPVRHPAAYRFHAALNGATSWQWIDLVFAALLSGKKTEPFLRGDRASDMHLCLCEIRDLTDELERRVAERGQGPS